MGIRGVNGGTMTGSDCPRGNATTQAFLAGNNVGGLSNFLNANTVARLPGSLPRRAGLPQNFIVVNAIRRASSPEESSSNLAIALVMVVM